MTTAPSATRTAAALVAHRGTVEKMLDRLQVTVRQMRRGHAKITVAAVSRRARRLQNVPLSEP